METFEKVQPIGKRKAFVHLNFGFRDKRNGFQEITEDEYPPEAEASGRELREARLTADLGLREAAALLGLTAVQLSDVERGRTRFVEAADRQSVLDFYWGRPASLPAQPTAANPTAEPERKP